MSTLRFGFTAQQIVDEGRITWEDISHLKTWLENQNLPKLTDEQIVLFLLSCFNEHEPTKLTIKAHYSVKSQCPQVFDQRDTKRADVQKQLNTMEICFLPERTDDGCVVVLVKLHDTYYGNFEMEPTMKIIYMTVDAALYEHPPKGLILIMDAKGAGIMHLTQIHFGMLKHLFRYFQEGLQVKLRKFHIFNTVYAVEKLFFIIKPFLKKEFYDMLVLHQSNMDMELFYEKWLPKRCLPEDYGGDLPSVRILHKQNIEKLTNLHSHFEEEALQRHILNDN